MKEARQKDYTPFDFIYGEGKTATRESRPVVTRVCRWGRELNSEEDNKETSRMMEKFYILIVMGIWIFKSYRIIQ